nr:acyltransferase [Nocardioides marinus]
MTGLRFVAAAAVVLHHTVGWQTPVAGLGYLGVSFFFVLSGFVLTWAGSMRCGARSFWRHRFARIYPLHLVVLVLVLTLPASTPDDTGDVLQHLLLVQAWSPGAAISVNPVSWSLSAEAFFYLLFPLLLPVLDRMSTAGLVRASVLLWLIQAELAVLVLGTVPRGHFLTYDLPLFRLPEFVIGAAAALLMARGYSPLTTARRAWFTTAALGWAVLMGVQVSTTTGMPWSIAASLSLPSTVGAICWAAARDADGRSPRVLASAAAQRLGAWSFAVYLVHWPLLDLLARALGRAEVGGLDWWWTPIVLAASTALAAAAHHWIERPAGQWVRRAGRRHRTTSTAFVEPVSS